jgi:hypothetical protein
MQAIHTHAHTDLGFGLPEEFRPFTQRLELRAASKDSTTQHRRRSRNSTVHGSRSHKDSSCGPRLGNPTVRESRSHKDRDAGRGGCSRTHTHRHTRETLTEPHCTESRSHKGLVSAVRIRGIQPHTRETCAQKPELRAAPEDPPHERRTQAGAAHAKTRSASRVLRIPPHKREPFTQRLDLRAEPWKIPPHTRGPWVALEGLTTHERRSRNFTTREPFMKSLEIRASLGELHHTWERSPKASSREAHLGKFHHTRGAGKRFCHAR